MERMRQLREEKGLSQARAAVRAGLDPSTWNRLEQGKGNPNLKTLERVATALGVEVAELLGKAGRRSSREPSLFNDGLEEERRTSGELLVHLDDAGDAGAWVTELLWTREGEFRKLRVVIGEDGTCDIYGY